MALADAMALIQSEKKESAEPKKKNVSFDIEEWNEMEKRHGKRIEPAHIKAFVLAVFRGEMTVTVNKK